MNHRNRYVPVTGHFAAVWHTANRLPDGNVLMVGGWRGGHSPSGRIELFDAQAGSFREAGRLRVARQYHRTVSLADGRLLVTGGDGWQITAPSAEIIYPGSGEIDEAGAPLEGRSGHTATLLRDGRVLLVGGLGAGGERPSSASATAELWDPATGEFRRAGGRPPIPRIGHAAARLPDGRVLVVGGWGISADYSLAEIFDPVSESFTTLPCPDERVRKGHTTLQLADGSVLVLGGDVCCDDIAVGWSPDASVLRFFSDGTGAEILPALSGPRALAPGAVGPDKCAWLFGGMVGWAASAESERYSVDRGYLAVSSLPAPRCNHTVTLLADGRFLIAGGENEWAELISDAFIYG